MVSRLPDEIDALWQERDTLSPADEDARKTVESAVDLLDMGAARVAVVEEDTDEIVVDERARRALELLPSVFGVTESRVAEFGHRDGPPLKWRFDGVRVVPGAVARWGSYLAPGTVLMPSFVDVGSHVGAGTMVDTWATVGAGAQIGRASCRERV